MHCPWRRCTLNTKMNKKMDKTVSVRGLNIEQWHQLGMEGNYLPVTICLEGDSMRPLMRRARDRVTIVPLQRELKIGDIVLFQGGEKRFVVHRVCALRDGMVCTLGDNCYNTDGWMPLQNIWGLVVQMERSGRIYSLDNALSRACGRLWQAALPMRRLYWRFRSFAARYYRKIFCNKKK